MTVTGWVFLAVFVLMVAGGAALIFAADRKRRPFAISGQEPHTASGIVSIASDENPADIAFSAISRVGGASISRSEEPLRIVGWVGKTLSNIPSRMEYELLIEARQIPGGSEFRCVARPRFAGSWTGGSRSKDLVDDLIGQVRAQDESTHSEM